jgi:acetyl esterase/lipase
MLTAAIQTCMKRKWPLVSASYRLLPQVTAAGLLEDAKAAYNFARALGGSDRQVIVAGASGGFFPATLIAQHLTPKPLALLSYTGIPTFRHPFFNSSTLIPPEPITEEEIRHLETEPVSVGTTPTVVFSVDMVLPSGLKNPDFQPSFHSQVDSHGQDPNRGLLYYYYLQENRFVPLVGSVDLGFDWASDPASSSKLVEWPFTILIQGDEDVDVHMDVCVSVARSLGPAKAKLIMAPGQGHRFQKTSFIEDVGPGMDEIRTAMRELELAVDRNLVSSGAI